ncbi:arginine--tRNA ligase [Candidatus Saccharibacteria bacterium]|nr:arginine--tRNA ligase [Candidatus Saccharibacteria bacterium]
MELKIKQTIERVASELFDISIDVATDIPEEKFGDVASNIALQLTKQVRKQPREIAELIAKNLQQEDSVQDVSVAGPGFINIRFRDEYLLSLVDSEPPKPLIGKKVLVEYSDPNPFKPLHAGHLYTTLVGDVLARMVESAGAETIRLNFGGDVGMHVGKTMWAILNKLGGEDVQAVKDLQIDSLGVWMGERYVEGNNAYEDNETARDEIRTVNKRVYQIHKENDHNSAFAQIYWYLRDQSYEFFKKLYSELQVVPFDRFIPESEVSEPGLQAVRKHIGSVFENSNGAVVFNGEVYGFHTRVFINNEGLPTYEAKDVGLSLLKWNEYHADQSIIITANEQAQYMQVVMKALEQFAPEASKTTRHLTHGVVKLSGGVKMSSRKGNILSAFDILQAARDVAGSSASEDTVLAAVKYALLKNRIGGDIIYDPNDSIALEGNSGPYLQYAHARACSILLKVEDYSNLKSKKSNLEVGERTLVRKLAQFSDVVELATAELAPHHICTYLYELAQEFNRFYEQNKVIGDARQEIRLALVKQYKETLKNGLNLLGIHAPEKM